MIQAEVEMYFPGTVLPWVPTNKKYMIRAKTSYEALEKLNKSIDADPETRIRTTFIIPDPFEFDADVVDIT
jgi:hypothetical protein